MEVIYQDVLGHPDFVRQLPNGSWGIDDLKCATQIRPSHFAQLGGYAWLMQQSTDRPRPSWLGIIRLNKECSGYEYLRLTTRGDIELAISAFLHYRAMYQLRNVVKGWVLDHREDTTLCTTT